MKEVHQPDVCKTATKNIIRKTVGDSMSNQYSHVTHHLRICSVLVQMNIFMRYEHFPNFSSISFTVPELQHVEVGIFRGKRAIFTTPAKINLSLNFDGVVQFI